MCRRTGIAPTHRTIASVQGSYGEITSNAGVHPTFRLFDERQGQADMDRPGLLVSTHVSVHDDHPRLQQGTSFMTAQDGIDASRKCRDIDGDSVA